VPGCLRRTLDGTDVEDPDGNWSPAHCDAPNTCAFILQGIVALFPSEVWSPGFVEIAVHRGNAAALREDQPLIGCRILGEHVEAATGTAALLDFMAVARAVRAALET
jgi:hypothetical protein